MTTRYDHVFYYDNLEHVAEAGPAAKGPFLEYAYPGLAGCVPCGAPALLVRRAC